MDKTKVAILTNILPTYREDFYDRIFDNPKFYVKVFCQKELPDSNVKTIHEKYGNKIELIKYYAPLGDERLVFQFYPFWRIFKNFDVVVVDGNLRNIILLLYSFLYLIFGKKVVIWSNVFSADGNPFFQKLRLKIWKNFKYFLTYTEKDRDILLENGFKNQIIVPINNGLNQKVIDQERNKWNFEKLEQFKKERHINSGNIIISSGRINKVNKHQIGLEAIIKAKIDFPDILWIIIGKGDFQDKLEKQIIENQLQKNVILLGEIYNESEKCPWFLLSDFLIHPGYIGLTIFNSFGYSLPVITHDNIRNHSPEFFLFVNEKTGYLFHEDSSEDLAKKIVEALRQKNQLQEMKNYSYFIVKDKHNTEKMAQNFEKMLDKIQAN